MKTKNQNKELASEGLEEKKARWEKQRVESKELCVKRRINKKRKINKKSHICIKLIQLDSIQSFQCIWNLTKLIYFWICIMELFEMYAVRNYSVFPIKHNRNVENWIPIEIHSEVL